MFLYNLKKFNNLTHVNVTRWFFFRVFSLSRAGNIFDTWFLRRFRKRVADDASPMFVHCSSEQDGTKGHLIWWRITADPFNGQAVSGHASLGSRVPRREKAKVVFTPVLDDDITLIDAIASYIDSRKKIQEEEKFWSEKIIFSVLPLSQISIKRVINNNYEISVYKFIIHDIYYNNKFIILIKSDKRERKEKEYD